MECRLCLSSISVKTSVSIFDDRNLPRESILSCCQLWVKKHDRLPERMCLLCNSNLKLLKDFKMMCVQSDAKARPVSDIKIEEVILDELVWEDEVVDSNFPIDRLNIGESDSKQIPKSNVSGSEENNLIKSNVHSIDFKTMSAQNDATAMQNLGIKVEEVILDDLNWEDELSDFNIVSERNLKQIPEKSYVSSIEEINQVPNELSLGGKYKCSDCNVGESGLMLQIKNYTDLEVHDQSKCHQMQKVLVMKYQAGQIRYKCHSCGKLLHEDIDLKAQKASQLIHAKLALLSNPDDIKGYIRRLDNIKSCPDMTAFINNRVPIRKHYRPLIDEQPLLYEITRGNKRSASTFRSLKGTPQIKEKKQNLAVTILPDEIKS